MRRLFTTFLQKWPEYFLEVLVITVGILGAFMLNGWKESRGESTEAQKVLLNLRNDFDSNFNSLEDFSKRLKAAADGGLEILQYFSEQRVPSNDRADSLVYALLAISTYNPADGALLDAINSGKTGLIKSDSLRNLLLSFSGKVARINRLETRAFNLLTTAMFPYLFDHYSFARMDSKLLQYDVDWPAGAFESDLDMIFNDRKFENMVDDHIWRCLQIYELQEALKDDIKEIIRLIDNELENS